MYTENNTCLMLECIVNQDENAAKDADKQTTGFITEPDHVQSIGNETRINVGSTLCMEL